MGSDWPQLSDKMMYIHIYSHSQLLIPEMKVRIYKTFVRHALMYRHKLWTLAQSDEPRLHNSGRKILCKYRVNTKTLLDFK